MTALYIFLAPFLLGPNCFILPLEGSYSNNELIDATPTILLLECVSVDSIQQNRRERNLPKSVRYNFKVMETLKGNAEATISWSNRVREYSPRTFNDHRDSSFWNYGPGRTAIRGGECGPPHSFQAGETFLYFVETKIHRKAAERIAVSDDRWLIHVRERIRAKQD